MRTPAIERDSGVLRLRRATSVTLAASGALAVAFAGLAARALPGRHAVATVKAPAAAATQRPTPPPLVAVQSSEAPSAPSSTPAQSQAPPVVVSGGS